MRSAIRLSFLIFVLSAGGRPVQATDLFVSPEGTGPYPTIQAAVDAAVDGDMIFLLPGVFTGPGNRDVEISVSLLIESNDPSDPGIIDCQGNADQPHRAFRFLNGVSLMRFVVIRNGHADNGGGILVESGELGLEACLIQDCHADAKGGGVFAGTGVSLFGHISMLSGNQADDGAAIWADAGGSQLLFRCTLHGNRDWYPLSDTGQIAVGATGSLGLEHTLISDGVYASGVSSEGGLVTATVCDVHGNTKGDYVGPLAGQFAVEGNISEYPRHCDLSAPEDGLNTLSPCLPANNDNGAIIGARSVGCTNESGVSDGDFLPSLVLSGAYPNPFNPRTDIRFGLAEGGSVVLEIMDTSGKRIRMLSDGKYFTAGSHQLTWDGTDDTGRTQPSGVYFFRVTAAQEQRTGKMALVR